MTVNKRSVDRYNGCAEYSDGESNSLGYVRASNQGFAVFVGDTLQAVHQWVHDANNHLDALIHNLYGENHE